METMKQLFNLFIAALISAPMAACAQSMVINTIAGNGTPGYSGDGGPATAAVFDGPSDVAVDATGNIFIADNRNHRIRKIDAATGIINTIAGTGWSGFYGEGVPASAAALSYPGEVKFDGAGNLYINDGLNHRIRKIDATTGLINTIVGGGTHAYHNGIAGTDIDGNVWPAGMGVDAAGNCYFMDGGAAMPRILRYDAASGIVTSFIDTAATSGFSGDGGPAADAALNNLNYYPGITMGIDATGNVYVTDIYNFRIRKVDATTGIINTIAGTGSMAADGDGGPATAAGLGLTYRMAISATGDLYFFSNISIRKIHAATNSITTLAGGGSSFANGILATAARLYSPYGIAVDAAQNIYYADNNGTIRKLTPACTSVTADTILSSAGNTFCDSAHTTLSLPGATFGVDVVYQWQSSPDGITWTNAGTGATSYIPATITATTYYRALVSCGSTPAIADSTAIDTITINSCPLSTTLAEANDDVSIYPNPGHGAVTLHLPAQVTGTASVTVYDLAGRLLKTINTTNRNTDIYLDVAPGTYLLSVHAGNLVKTLRLSISR